MGVGKERQTEKRPQTNESGEWGVQQDVRGLSLRVKYLALGVVLSHSLTMPARWMIQFHTQP